jgi:hypothetical protein
VRAAKAPVRSATIILASPAGQQKLRTPAKSAKVGRIEPCAYDWGKKWKKWMTCCGEASGAMPHKVVGKGVPSWPLRR